MFLTDRQQEIFQSAKQTGYFEVPRRVSLTELAAQLAVSKGYLSRALAIVEREMVTSIDPLYTGRVDSKAQEGAAGTVSFATHGRQPRTPRSGID
jgi:hypothetical protein